PRASAMDEPLGALDAEFRQIMTGELRRLHDRLGATTIYVTHDQLEAMALADKIAVMNHGVIEQLGTPREIYQRPVSLFVADFIGSPPINFPAFRTQFPCAAPAAPPRAVRTPRPPPPKDHPVQQTRCRATPTAAAHQAAQA